MPSYQLTRAYTPYGEDLYFIGTTIIEKHVGYQLRPWRQMCNNYTNLYRRDAPDSPSVYRSNWKLCVVSALRISRRVELAINYELATHF